MIKIIDFVHCTNIYNTINTYKFLIHFIGLFVEYSQVVLLHYPGHEMDAGRIGLCIVLAGMLGAVCCGIILDKTHLFKWVFPKHRHSKLFFGQIENRELNWNVVGKNFFELCMAYYYKEESYISNIHAI